MYLYMYFKFCAKPFLRFHAHKKFYNFFFKSIKSTILNLKKQNTKQYCLVYIANVKFHKASFNSHQDGKGKAKGPQRWRRWRRNPKQYLPSFFKSEQEVIICFYKITNANLHDLLAPNTNKNAFI